MICVLFSIRRIVFLALAIALVGFSSLAVNRTEADEVRIAKRVPWQGSRVTGTPEPPPPFKSVRAFPHLKFDHPLLMVRYPQDDRLIVGEQSGVLYSFTEGTSGPASVFFDLRKEVTTVSQLSGAKEIEFVYGVAFHRQFTTNRQCFICYTIRGPGGEANLKDGTRVSRFTVTTADPPRVDPDSEQILLTWLQGGHNG